MSQSLSKISSVITRTYLQTQIENQYFERKGLGDKDIKASKLADELIGTLTAGELAELLGIHHNTIRAYLTSFVEQGILERHSNKIRDVLAKYGFRK